PAVNNFMLGFSKDRASPILRTVLNGHSYKAQIYLKRVSMSEIPYENNEKCAQ
ncbi:unnamed protein product, partial [Rotaria sp. Silwood2]